MRFCVATLLLRGRSRGELPPTPTASTSWPGPLPVRWRTSLCGTTAPHPARLILISDNHLRGATLVAAPTPVGSLASAVGGGRSSDRSANQGLAIIPTKRHGLPVRGLMARPVQDTPWASGPSARRTSA